MPKYKTLDTMEGARCLPSIKSIFFKPLEDDSYFVEPWENREMADCADFQLGTGENGAHEVFVFVEDEELISFLKDSDKEIYLYGAYNQITVVQMRALVRVVIEEDHPDVDAIRSRCRSAIEARIDAFVNKLSKEEAAARLRVLDNGTLFCFKVREYAYDFYERG